MKKTEKLLPLLAAGLYFAFSLLAPGRAGAAGAQREGTCLVEAAWTEARGLPPRDVDAVMWVLVNRTRAPGWPATLCGVYRQRGQFDGLRRGLPRPRGPAEAAALGEIEREAAGVESGAVPDPTRGAVYFYSPRQRIGLGRLSPPAFATAGSWRARVGPFEFYGPRRQPTKERKHAGHRRRAPEAHRDRQVQQAREDGHLRHHR